MNRKSIPIVLVLVALAILVVVPASSVYREIRQQRLNQELIVACSRLDVAAVRQTLCAGASPNAVDCSYSPQPSLRDYLQRLFTHRPEPSCYRPTALIQAFKASMGLHDRRQEKLTPIVKLLLDQGAQPDVCDIVGDTLVDEASEFDYSRASALLLLEKGACPMKLDRCLLKACAANDMATIKLLLMRGADPNATGRLNCISVTTPLLCAVSTDRLSMASYLLQHGADPNQHFTGEMENLSLLVMVSYRHQTAMASLLKRYDATLPTHRKPRISFSHSSRWGVEDLFGGLTILGFDDNMDLGHYGLLQRE